MQIHTSGNPAEVAGSRISEIIASHSGDVLCLLSGGSALDVVEYINITENNECRAPRALPTATPKGRTEGDIAANGCECRTIFVMGDERVSGEQSINNYLQLTERYPGHAVKTQTIETIPEVSESASDFAERIEKNILQIISESKSLKIISLLGIGTDGHTAGIFPMSKESFQDTYRDDRTYVSVRVEGLKIDSRASITPSWIQSSVDEILLFVAGESKRMILESLINESKELHERPAELIKQHTNTHIFTDIEIRPK